VTDVIELRGLRLLAVVGVGDDERSAPQPLEVDVDLARPFARAAASDDVAATTDYSAVVALVERVAAAGGFSLLETLADRVAREVLAIDEAVESVTVAVRKLRPPVPSDLASAGVRTTVSR
jgi:7,8-dihydroneopterin aldolase/epimerase/oxygenase